MSKFSLLPVALICLTSPAIAASGVQCPIPAGFAETAAPDIEPAMLVDHIEEITINRSLDVVMAEANRTPIEKTMHGTSALPGVAGTHMLRGTWPEPGARRVTCLTDGGSTEEQVVVNVRTGNTHHFGTTRRHKRAPLSMPLETFSRATSAMAAPASTGGMLSGYEKTSFPAILVPSAAFSFRNFTSTPATRN